MGTRSRVARKRWQRNTSRGLVPLVALGAAGGGQVALAADPPVEPLQADGQVESFATVGAYEACDPGFGEGKEPLLTPVLVERNGVPVSGPGQLPSGFRAFVTDSEGGVVCEASVSPHGPEALEFARMIYSDVIGTPTPIFTAPGLIFLMAGEPTAGAQLQVVSGTPTPVPGSPFPLDDFQKAMPPAAVVSLTDDVALLLMDALGDAEDDEAIAHVLADAVDDLSPTYRRLGLAFLIDFLWEGCATFADLNPFFADPVGNRGLFVDTALECGFGSEIFDVGAEELPGVLEDAAFFMAFFGIVPHGLYYDGPSDPEADPPFLAFGLTVPASSGTTPAPAPEPTPVPNIEQEAGAGETVSTLPPGAKVTLEAPVGVSVTTPVAGTVSITTTVGEPDDASTGFSMLGLSVTITAPSASAADPLNLAFVLDASLVGDEDPMTIVPLRNGVEVPDCDDPDGTTAEPDPCVGGRSVDEDGDLTISVRTSAASTWTFGTAIATPTPVPVPDSGCAPAVFTDVPRDGTHTTAIDCAAFRGITQGFGDGTFRPEQGVRRDQMASFLVRTLEGAGHPLPASSQDFADLAGNVHAEAIGKLAAAGIAQGTSAETYSPDAVVSRAQVASFLTRALSWGGVYLPPGGARYFSDTLGDAHADAIDAAFELGLVLGKSEDTYDPSGSVRRDQMASYLMRLFDKL